MTEQTAQVISQKSNEGIIAADTDNFVLHALSAQYSRDVLQHVDLVVVAMLFCLECSARFGCLENKDPYDPKTCCLPAIFALKALVS